MIQDSNHELSEQQFGSLVARGNRMWFHLSNIQAEMSTVTVLRYRLAAACKAEIPDGSAENTH